jgi:NOL1/NOP2/fmu family ribosome biogenesis protein
LFRRDEDAMEQWSLNNVQLCSQRQQRILADVWPALKQNGMMIYSTCSYSTEEDEEIVEWMMEQLAAGSKQLAINADWDIVEIKTKSQAFGYRFWPYKLKGEGFFIACLKKLDGEEESSFKSKNKLESLNKREIELVEKWIKTDHHYLVKTNGAVYAMPGSLITDINILYDRLHVNYFGVKLGELVHEKFIPDHALAMSGLISDAVEKIELNYEDAIKYLQKKELNIPGLSKGWKLVTYEGFSLGWINVLPNRINNYYPKVLRILKEI